MIQPEVLASELPHGPWSCRGCDVWEAIGAAARGDAATPLAWAIRRGHRRIAEILRAAGATQ